MKTINYSSLSKAEILLSVCTLTGGALAQRHWQAEGFCRWGHRLIALIEAIPVLGGLVALIEIAAMNYLFRKAPPPQIDLSSEPSLIPYLELNIRSILTLDQVLKLKISPDTFESTLPAYANCLFEATPIDRNNYSVIRREKGIPPPLRDEPVRFSFLQSPTGAQNRDPLPNKEGTRIRTYCLELLSTIDDAIKKAPSHHSTVLEECKGVVRFFIENHAWERQATISDFIELIELLKKRAPEISNRLNRFSDLAQLKRDMLHKTVVDRWGRLKQAIRLQLFKELDQTSERIEAIGLRTIPPIAHCERIVNLHPMIDAINLVESNHREAAHWLMTRLRVFTFRELCQSIQKSCLELRNPILSYDRYALLTIQGKSQEWMANLAVRYLPKEKMPETVFPMHHEDAGESLFNCLKTSGLDHFILFDDAAYSGKQAIGYVSQLYNALMRQGAVPFRTKKTIHLVFGFFPEDLDLQNQIQMHDLETYNMHIRVLTSCRIKSCNMLMEQEKLSKPLRSQIANLVGSISKPLVATEWKKPDFMSLPLFLSQGWCHEWEKKSYGELRHSISEAMPTGKGPICDIAPPYRKN